MDSILAEYTELIARITLGLEAFILLFIAFVVRGLICHRSYQGQIHKLTQEDNVASATDLAAYLFAVLLALLDSLTIEGESLISQCSELAYMGIGLMFVLELSQQLSDRILFRGIDLHVEIHQKRNLALAVTRASFLISLSMMIRGSLSHPQAWTTMGLWIVVGFICIALLGVFFQWLTPYDDLGEIQANNMAAALPLAGAWYASGITVESAVSGESTHFIAELGGVVAYLVVAGLIIFLVRFCLHRLFFKGIDLNHEITEDKNAGIGLIEAILYLSVAEIICFFLS